jgi:hypothetical protein
LGGLPKKAYQINELQKKNAVPSLVLDGGSLLFKTKRITPGLAEKAAITAKGIAQAYNKMGYHAVGIARRDLAGGLAFLKEISSQAEFPLLSANVVYKSTGATVFTPKLLQTVGSLSIGIIGITGSSTPSPFDKTEDAEILPWEDVLPDITTELSKTSDMIILLSNHKLMENTKIARTVPGIHLIIQSGESTANLAPIKIDNTLIFQTAKQGKYLGWMEIHWLDTHIWEDNTLKNELILKKKELDKTNQQIKSLLQDHKTPETTKTNDTYQALKEKKERLLNESKRLATMIDQQHREHPSSTYTNHFVALRNNLPDDPQVLKIVDSTKHEVNKLEKERALQQLSKEAFNQDESARFGYTGWQFCARCHHTQAAFWKKTGHANAYKTLVDKQQNFNLDCLPCHVTYDPGNKSVKLKDILSFPDDLLTVGCELCHGSGTFHNEDPAKQSMVPRPAEKICNRCHTPKRDDNFIYQKDIKVIACPPCIICNVE